MEMVSERCGTFDIQGTKGNRYLATTECKRDIFWK